MKRALLALALSLSASFLLSSCGDNAAKERARIKGEIEIVKDSLEFVRENYQRFEDSLQNLRKPGAPSPKTNYSAFMLRKRAQVDPNSPHYYFTNKIRFYQSRLDSLNRKLQELPDK